MIRILVFVAALVMGVSAAQARHHHPHYARPACVPGFFQPCPGFGIFGGIEPTAEPHRGRHHRRGHWDQQEGATEVVAHPDGCPWRAFCGCGAAVRVFGHPVESLAAAAGWYRFPRAEPAPGMVAVRRHHVFVIEAVLGRGTVRAYDANSGSHLTRIHERSIAGYTIVNPRG